MFITFDFETESLHRMLLVHGIPVSVGVNSTADNINTQETGKAGFVLFYVLFCNCLPVTQLDRMRDVKRLLGVLAGEGIL